MIHVYTGEGEGKTSAAFGLALRHSSYGKALVVQFLKKEFSGEVGKARGAGIRVEQFGEGFFTGDDFEKHRRKILEGLEFVKHNLDDYSLVVLDEVNVALSLGLLGMSDVMFLLGSNHEIVFTGRGAPEELVEAADYVTSFDKVKHPFDNGVSAREGVEF